MKQLRFLPYVLFHLTIRWFTLYVIIIAALRLLTEQSIENLFGWTIYATDTAFASSEILLGMGLCFVARATCLTATRHDCWRPAPSVYLVTGFACSLSCALLHTMFQMGEKASIALSLFTFGVAIYCLIRAILYEGAGRFGHF